MIAAPSGDDYAQGRGGWHDCRRNCAVHQALRDFPALVPRFFPTRREGKDATPAIFPDLSARPNLTVILAAPIWKRSTNGAFMFFMSETR